MWGKLKVALFRSTETVIALVLVLLFFAGFLVILSLSFPKGASLQDLILSRQWEGGLDGTGGIDFELVEEEQLPAIVAMLARTHRSVKSKPADAIAWRNAQSGIALENRHSIQTLAKSAARISFGAGNDLELGANSLIVIRGSKGDGRGGPVASPVLLGGEMAGRVGSGASDLAIEIVTATGATLRLASGAPASDYRVTMNPDHTATFSLFKGEGQVTSAGHTVTLRSHQTLTVKANQAPGLPVALPDAPAVLGPSDGEVQVFRTNPPRVRFEWDGPANAEAYQIEIARDPQFEDVVHEARVDDTAFTHGNLDAGTYWWRVTSVAGWAEGPGAPARKLRMVQDTEPPVLDVVFPNAPVEAASWTIEGRAEPGAEVWIGDLRVPTGESGEFAQDLTLEPGVNVVVVEALDGAGNVAYRSRLITARFEPGESEIHMRGHAAGQVRMR